MNYISKNSKFENLVKTLRVIILLYKVGKLQLKINNHLKFVKSTIILIIYY